MGRKDTSTGSKTQQAIIEAEFGRDKAPKYLAYALPGKPDKEDTNIIQTADEFDLYDVHLKSPESFLDFEGVVLFGGVFECPANSYEPEEEWICRAPHDLDLRERQFWTAIEQGRIIVFLVPALHVDYTTIHRGRPPQYDLFKRIIAKSGIPWETQEEPNSLVSSNVPEFRAYMEQYGSGYVCYELPQRDTLEANVIATTDRRTFGFAIGSKLFVLPAVYPQSHDHAISMAVAALQGAIAYRARMMKRLPEWTGDFHFSQELELKKRADALRTELAEIDSSISEYASVKGALCYQSTPLLEVISEIMNRFFDIALNCDEKFIEDASITDDEGNILAVFEIKGVKKNFSRADVNQVDSHRERQGLPPETPGLLVMNTFRSPESLEDKDTPPNSEIIQKGVAENVLLIRTLDLLRYADGIEKGVFSKDEFRETILSKTGWLKVENETIEVMVK